MNWIKEQVEARRKAEEERQAEQKSTAKAQAEHQKQMRTAAPQAFAKLAETIVANVEELNRHSNIRFGVRYGSGSPVLEVHHFGVLDPLLALALDVQAERINYKHITVGQRGVRTGFAEIVLKTNGSPMLSFAGAVTSFEEAAQRLLSPIF